jgi:hypothetical protein
VSATTWTISDVMDIVREGVPFADMSSISLQTNYQGDLNLVVTITMAIPVDKAQHISIHSDNLNSFWFQMVHPNLSNDGNWIQIDGILLWNIIDGKVRIPIKLNLCQDAITRTAREVRDSNFYSALEAALSD